MSLLSLNLPVVGQSSATEDQKVRDALATIQTGINGNLDAANAPALGAWRPLKQGESTFAGASGPATVLTPQGTSGGIAVMGAAATAQWAFLLDPADYQAGATLRLRSMLFTNSVAPGITITLGVRSVATFNGAAPALPGIASVGAAVLGVSHVTPGANASLDALSGAIAIPTRGWYCFVVDVSAVSATNAQWVHVYELQVK